MSTTTYVSMENGRKLSPNYQILLSSITSFLKLCHSSRYEGYQVNIFLISPQKHMLWVVISSDTAFNPFRWKSKGNCNLPYVQVWSKLWCTIPCAQCKFAIRPRKNKVDFCHKRALVRMHRCTCSHDHFSFTYVIKVFMLSLVRYMYMYYSAFNIFQKIVFCLALYPEAAFPLTFWFRGTWLYPLGLAFGGTDHFLRVHIFLG